MTWLVCGGVFLVSILVDISWGLHIRRAAAGSAFSAANYAALIMVFGAVNVLSYTNHPWLLVPIILGNWVGTYSIVRWDHRKESRNAND